MDYKDFYDEVGKLLEIWNRGEFNPDELIDGIEAARQGVQSDENTTEAFIAEFIEFVNDAYLHEDDRQKILGFLRERSRR